MPPYIDQSSEDFQYRLRVDNLPSDVNQKLIQDQFSQYGTIGSLYLKRRRTRDSPTLLPNPHVIIFYADHQSIDAVMANRPLFMKDRELRIRRCLPMTRRYPYEFNLTTNKMLVRAFCDSEHQDQILPNDETILDYLKATGGNVLRWERFDERTLFIEFDDYDPVDICCLSRPHFIKDQMIEIEKCSDEQQARRRAQYHQKNRSSSLRVSSTKTSNDTISPTLTLNANEQTMSLASNYENKTQHIEDEHKQMISELKNQLEETIRKRILLERLTTDYKNEQKRLTADNRRWQKLFSDSLTEKPRVQANGERKLAELTQEYSRLQKLYNQL